MQGVGILLGIPRRDPLLIYRRLKLRAVNWFSWQRAMTTIGGAGDAGIGIGSAQRSAADVERFRRGAGRGKRCARWPRSTEPWRSSGSTGFDPLSCSQCRHAKSFDFDQLDGFAARTFDHDGARVSKLVCAAQTFNPLTAVAKFRLLT